MTDKKKEAAIEGFKAGLNYPAHWPSMIDEGWEEGGAMTEEDKAACINGFRAGLEGKETPNPCPEETKQAYALGYIAAKNVQYWRINIENYEAEHKQSRAFVDQFDPVPGTDPVKVTITRRDL